MPAVAGRKVRIKYDADGGGAGSAAVIAGAKADSGSINNESIDATDKDSGAWRTLLDDVGVKTVDLSLSGVLKDDTLLNLAVAAGAGTALHTFELDIEGIGTFRGQFFINSFEPGGNDGAEVATFSCGLQSSGTIAWTPSP